jgi:hypothetical protein
MRDLDYLMSSPLLARIYRHCARLKNQARKLPGGSAERRALTKRISQLEPYALPKPDLCDLWPREPILNAEGRTTGTRYSLRDRFVNPKIGRPEERTIQTRAALEIKLKNKNVTWRQLAEQFKFPNERALQRSVRRLKSILKREKIKLR